MSMSSEKVEIDYSHSRCLLTPKVCANTSFESFHSSLNANTYNNQKSENTIWCDEYLKDILTSLKESEKRRRNIDYKTRQMSHRAMLLILMEITAIRIPLNRTTLHLAVYLLDGFMDTYTIAIDKLNASALMCILIAAKIEEADQNVPKFAQLNEIVQNVYTSQDFKAVEKKIITTFEFDLIHPTAATFVESYSNQLVSYQDYLFHQIHHHHSNTRSGVFSTYESMIKDSTELLFNILDVTLHDSRLVNNTPSVVGAACLAATRSLKKIQPVWTERLIELTGYNYEKIEPIVEALEVLYKLHAPKADKICDSPESGIASASDCQSESETESESESKTETDSEDEFNMVEYHPAIKRRRIFE